MRIFRFCTVDGTSPHVWVWFIYLDLDLGAVSTYKMPQCLATHLCDFFLMLNTMIKDLDLIFLRLFGSVAYVRTPFEGIIFGQISS